MSLSLVRRCLAAFGFGLAATCGLWVGVIALVTLLEVFGLNRQTLELVLAEAAGFPVRASVFVVIVLSIGWFKEVSPKEKEKREENSK